MMKKTAIRELSLNDLLAAERVLAILNKKMEDDFQKEGKSWSRAKMQQHVDELSRLVLVRNTLLQRAYVMKKSVGKPPTEKQNATFL